MDKKSLQSVKSGTRDLFQKAVQAGKKKNYDYGIKLLLNIVSKDPALMPAREKLREYEALKSDKAGFIKKMLARFKSSGQLPKIKALSYKEPLKAMRLCEEVLAEYLYNNPVLNLLAEAAEKAGALFISIEALEIIRAREPGSESNLRKLFKLYKKNDEGVTALKIFQEIAAMHPDDITVQTELRSAVALASMQQGDWEKEGASQDKVKDKDDAVIQQLESGTIHDADQADVVIQKYLAELDDNDSVDTRRKLADAYLVKKDYENARVQYEAIQNKLGRLDPALDKKIEKAYLAQIDVSIEELKSNPDKYENPEQQVAELEQHKMQYRMDKASARVEIYPHDGLLRFDLAVMYYEAGFIEESVEQFQQARNNPQKKLAATVYLGRCFHRQGQMDMAIEQYTAALQEMNSMNEQKKETLYCLGKAYEQCSRKDEAIKCFKDIYQSDVNYKDVSKLVMQR
ncbi:tetratricopeptide repeat protein [Lentisphaerota bacterium ZTH]|nr:tetratricopeptide repeat protein [Lentisphaerota bacterium]WET07145.1 tetratricopeptide repeat protein [Lentisphaerota bacterium ZTH]